jgi:hypothetical protein
MQRINGHFHKSLNPQSQLYMERILLWWDDLDDLVHAARHLVAVTASRIVQAVLRRSIPIYCSALAGMAGLGCLLIYRPTDYAMPVFLACMALLVIISQMITWGVTARAAGRHVDESPYSNYRPPTSSTAAHVL